METLFWLKTSKGFLLLELLISMMVMMTVMGSIFSISTETISTIKTVFYQQELYQTLHYARFLALARDEDINFTPQDTHILIENNTETLSTIPIQPNLSVFIKNKLDQIGFKSYGNTKYSRTLAIISNNHSQEITVPPTYGKISIK